jgi:hypothetical protein
LMTMAAQTIDLFQNYVSVCIDRAKGATPDQLLNMNVAVSVGPTEAAAILSFSKGNRTLGKATVEKYARLMRDGHWLEEDNDNAVSFDRSGRLINGHHRLHAVIKAGVRIRTVLRFGRPEQAIFCTDNGRARTIGDQLSFSGESISQYVQASVRVLEALRNGKLNTHVEYGATEIRDIVAGNAYKLEALKLGRKKFPAPFWGACLYAYDIDPVRVCDFVEEVISGEGITGPSYRLREYMLKRQSEGRGAGGSYSKDLTLRTLQALSAYLERRPFSKFGPLGDSGWIWFQNAYKKAAK